MMAERLFWAKINRKMNFTKLRSEESIRGSRQLAGGLRTAAFYGGFVQ
jgi:hypothetical protein